MFMLTSLTLGLWLVALAKDICVRRNGRAREIFWLIRHEPWMQNFTTRFAYEAFFELFLCALLSLAIDERYADNNIEYGTEEELNDY